MRAQADPSAYALLTDGTTIEIRPVRPDDFDAVRDMHAKMSPENLYLRFFGVSRSAAEGEARRVCREPAPDHAALLPAGEGDAGPGTYRDAVAERERSADVASLRHVLTPASVAVIGASRRPRSVGRAILRNIIDNGFPAGSMRSTRARPNWTAFPACRRRRRCPRRLTWRSSPRLRPLSSVSRKTAGAGASRPWL